VSPKLRILNPSNATNNPELLAFQPISTMYGRPPATPPTKYTKINGIMKLNPEWKRWKESQGQTGTSLSNSNEALAVVTSMEDHAAFNQASVKSGGREVPLSESTNATIELMQDPDICVGAGMTPDSAIDELGAVLSKYEVPLGLMNKLMMLSEFESLEFIIDDSGSMGLPTDTIDPRTRQPMTRWQEAQSRLKEMMELVAHVPFQKADVRFLNRPTRLSFVRNNRTPQALLQDMYRQIDQAFGPRPSGSTPAFERLQESFALSSGHSVARYFFGDGIPDGGVMIQQQIIAMLKNRPNPSLTPVTFISCSNEDEQVEWMKDAEELAPYCSESDDYHDEATEVLRDQGKALPYTKGFHLVCQLVAAMNPDDLDAMDESVPFTKATLDNLLGIEHNVETYKYYFDSFLQAQRVRTVERDDFGHPKAADEWKKQFNWMPMYNDFLQAPLAKQIPNVQNFLMQLRQLEGNTPAVPVRY
jgi:hypothetical protein